MSDDGSTIIQSPTKAQLRELVGRDVTVTVVLDSKLALRGTIEDVSLILVHVKRDDGKTWTPKVWEIAYVEVHD